MKKLIIIFLILLLGVSSTSHALVNGVMRVCRPGERASTCFWADDFKSQAYVEASNGIIIGSPTFSNNGVDLDSSNPDYISYSIDSVNLEEFAIVIEFTPDFDVHESSNRRTFFSNSAGTTRFQRYETTTYTDNLRLYINGTLVINGRGNVNDYADLWNDKGKNYLVINAKSGDTDIFLNGSYVQEADSTTYSTEAISTLLIGSYGGSYNFDGTIHNIKMFSKKLDDLSAIAYSSGSMDFNYEKNYLVNYLTDTKTAQSGKIVDVQGNYDATISGTVVKETGWGYYFDGSNDYAMTDIVSQLSTANTITISCWVKPRTVVSNIVYSIESNSTFNVGLLLNLVSGFNFFSGGVGGAQAANFIPPPVNFGIYHIVGQYDGTNTKIWVNGSKGTNALSPLPPSFDGNQVITLGARKSLVSDYKGFVSRIHITTEVLNEVQIQDLYYKELKSINRVQ